MSSLSEGGLMSGRSVVLPLSWNSISVMTGLINSLLKEASMRGRQNCFSTSLLRGVPISAMFFTILQASCACFSVLPCAWLIIAQSLSTNLTFYMTFCLTLSDFSERQETISRMASRTSREEQSRSLVNSGILQQIRSSQSSSFCSTRERSRSMPVSRSSYRSLSRNSSTTSKSSLQSNPACVRLLRMSDRLRVTSRSMRLQKMLRRVSITSEFSTDCRFLGLMSRLRMARVMLRRHYSPNRFLGGQWLRKYV